MSTPFVLIQKRLKKSSGNGPVTLPFTILNDFMLANDSECGAIWAENVKWDFF
jgi:hypothetical protein